ncbi:MAG TPA: type II toxin-antitoxin system PemK/MazF family toxin [Conexibacter sp.]|jgi:Arc/MetJ-type ribon-helix-helix transcriptional regulator/mRNA-degrading endonuclease toxin of MazEF toxin-antitoxin module|nr:type II toxin-antitoxin system PemK/MazF family toxin [Conexibacter sp.]
MSRQIAVRLPEELLERIDRLCWRGTRYADRASIVRAALRSLLDEAEAEAHEIRGPAALSDISDATAPLAGDIFQRASSSGLATDPRLRQGSVWEATVGGCDLPVVVVTRDLLTVRLPFVAVLAVRSRDWPVDETGKVVLGEVELAPGRHLTLAADVDWSVNCDLIFSVPKRALAAYVGQLPPDELAATLRGVGDLLAIEVA